MHRPTAKGLAILSACFLFALTAGATGEIATKKISLKEVDTWGYQLQNVRPRFVPKDKFDILVVDYSRNGTDERAFKSTAVDLMRKRAGQPDRIILAYLSIGEAEAYRYYWKPSWIEKANDALAEPTVSSSTSDSGPLKPIEAGKAPVGFRGALNGEAAIGTDNSAPLARLSQAAPIWLAAENPTWRGNHLVRYWDAEWQAIIFGSPNAYLDKIIDAGFDGVYLDKIDSNDDWQASRPTAERDMVDFVKRLAAHARGRKPGFLIVPQNGEELLEFKDYVQTIDAIAKEDMLFGGGRLKDGDPNPRSEIIKAKRHLEKALRAGRKVFAVEYLDNVDQIIEARKRLLGLGYVPNFARRALDETPIISD